MKNWLAQEHGVEVALPTVYKYLGKCEARLKVPPPSHARQDAAAAETFKSELVAELETVLTGVLARYWSDAKRIRDLIGSNGWLVAQNPHRSLSECVLMDL